MIVGVIALLYGNPDKRIIHASILCKLVCLLGKRGLFFLEYLDGSDYKNDKNYMLFYMRICAPSTNQFNPTALYYYDATLLVVAPRTPTE